MKDALTRPVAFNSHPVVQQTYILPTPSIDDAYNQAKQVIRHRTPGALLFGQSRFGKTYAVRYICTVLRDDFPKIEALIYSCKKKKKPAESAFFENFLDTAGHQDPLSGTVNAKRLRLIKYLVARVKHSGLNLLVLFADEAHRLESIEYEWLHDIHSDLERFGIRMITFLVGHQRLINQKSAFKRAGETSIIGRFMIDEIPFRGVRNVEDVATCLAGFDDANYPEQSGWNYTRFFLPHAYQQGLRLEQSAEFVWEAFLKAHSEAGFSFDIDIPMQYFARAIEITLTDYASKDSADFVLTQAIWEQSVMASKYVVAVEELRMRPDVDD
jgi:type II secretory pathway predicted ATPase ExeA